MTAAPTPPYNPRAGRFLAGLSLTAILLGAVALALSAGGCSKPPRSVGDTTTEAAKEDPWVTAGAKLRKETDLASTKSTLNALTNDVSLKESERLPAMSNEALASLEATIPLSPADREEIRGAAYSSHDPVYLADCFYLRDAARSLALTGLPVEKQADLAFAWVCRQVYLTPWLRALGADRGALVFDTTALPPTVVLRRGFGSGLERAYVYLALLQQLELEGCLIGGPTPGTSTQRFAVQVPPNASPQAALAQAVAATPRGPFWAVGVRIGNDVRLFDPWRGTTFPLTLNQLKANPDAAKAWFEDKANLSSATLEDAKKATVFLAVPVNSLSPRMAIFESKLKGELNVKVAFDAQALAAKRAAYPDPKPAFWNPVNDPFSYGRAARSYLPVDLGGSDTTPGDGRLYEASVRDQIPASAFEVPMKLGSPSAKLRFRALALSDIGMSFLEPPNPRERIQRGQFVEAARDMVAKQERFATGLERVRVADPEQTDEWIKTADQLYEELGRTQLPGSADKAAEAAVMTQIENHWKQTSAMVLLDKASAEVGRAEASFLLGLCKHEQAERLQTRLERATGAEAERLKPEAILAWKTALSAWRTYEQLAAAHSGFPGRAAHASALAARAAKLAEPDKK